MHRISNDALKLCLQKLDRRNLLRCVVVCKRFARVCQYLLAESFQGVKTLDLAHRNLTRISEYLGNLSALETLRLRYNDIVSNPNLGKLFNLTQLSLENNKLESLPESFGDLTNLTYLCISSDLEDLVPENLAGVIHKQ